MKTLLSLSVLLLLLTGCGTPAPHNPQPSGRVGHLEPGHLGAIAVGMTRDQVIAALGQPESVSASPAGETLSYVEERPWWQWKTIAVQLHDGHVTQFGEK